MIKRNEKKRIWSCWCNQKNLETQQKVSLIEEKLRAIEESSSIKGMDAFELSLVLDVIIPHKFKMLDFKKYKGSTFPRAYIVILEPEH